MKITLILGAIGSLAAAALWQTPIPTALKGHTDTLKAAQSLTAKITLTPVGGVGEEVKLTFSKPNLWKMESASGFSLFDGSKAYQYDAASKTYTETDMTGEAAAEAVAAKPEIWAWSAFFTPVGLKDVTGATRGKAQKIRGLDLTPVVLAFSKPDMTATLYMDDKIGAARGISFKQGDKDFIAIASEFALGKEVLPEADFAFVAPEGATKAVAPVPGMPTFKEVSAILSRSCMPCHNSQNHRANYDLSSYDSVMASPGAVKVDAPDDSFIIRSLKGDRAQQMPYKKSALPAAQIKLIRDWMAAGAKND